ncbi:cache domain-containing protein, partial [Halobium palmae]
MKIRTKLIALCLIISLVPVSVVGGTGLQTMGEIGTYAQEESTAQMEDQVTAELNNTVSARRAGIQNVLDVRRVDARSLADSSSVQNYQAARDGQWRLVQRQSQQQVGHIALQMHATVESTKRTVLEEKYGGKRWEQLTPRQQREVEREVEETLVGTSGNGTDASGTISRSFQPGYIGDTGYAYITDEDSNIVSHHSLPDGFNLREDASLRVFADIKSTVRTDSAVRNGRDWGIAEYDWEDTTQAGNPVERKFIAYTYHEDFDWVLAPSVYYYELQATASESAKDRINASFRSYLNTRSVSIEATERPAYDEILLTDESGAGIVRSYRIDGGDGNVVSESVADASYGERDWFRGAKSLAEGEVHVGDVRSVDGERVVYVSSPVYQGGEFKGVVALRFDYGILSAMTNDVTVGETGYLSVVDDEGRVLSHPDEAVVDREASITDEAYAGTLAGVAESSVLAGERGLGTFERTDENGTTDSYYVGYAPLQFGDRQYALLATVPEEDVTAPAAALGADLQSHTDSARNFLLMLIGGVGVVVVGVGYGSARFISRPIERVRDRATALAAGRFEDEDDISAPDDEIGELVDAFEEMQGNLERQITELGTVSENLGEGRLDQEVRTDLPGEFGAIMTDLDEGIGRLQEGFAEIRRTSAHIKRGELDVDVDADLPGEYGAVLADLESGVRQLSRGFDQIDEASSQLREGNLDQEFETELPGQYGAVMTDLEAGLEEVARSLAEVNGVVEEFAEASAETLASAEEIESASQETAESVEEIAHGAEQQTEQLQATAAEMNDISASIEEVAASADGVVETATEAVSIADRGRENAADAT